jgi:hypothetical protein
MVFSCSRDTSIEYHIGIIDYFQLYDMQKSLEKWSKRLIKCERRLDTSSQDCELYANRFIAFVKKIVGDEDF